jgi:hypothetical protein
VTRVAWARLGKCYRENVEKMGPFRLVHARRVDPDRGFGEHGIPRTGDQNRISTPHLFRTTGPEIFAGTQVVEFSPTSELQQTIE